MKELDEKLYVRASDLLYDSFQLGVKVLQSGFVPDYIVAIWRGGTPVGIAVQELLDYAGIKTDHIAIRTSYYLDIGKVAESVQVHGLGYLIDKVDHDSCLLIIDDIFDSGNSIAAVLKELTARAKRNTPRDIRIATLWYKPSKNVTNYQPNYFMHETDRWVVFPHELQGLSVDEVRNGKPEIFELVSSVERSKSD